MSPELKKHLLFKSEYKFREFYFESSDIFSFGLILFFLSNNMEEFEIYNMNTEEKVKELIQ